MPEDPEQPRVEAVGDAGFKVHSFRARHDHVIAVTGELDLATVGLLEAGLDAAQAAGAERIVLDLRKLAFADSSGVKAVIKAQRRVGDRLVLVRGPRPIDRLFELCGLNERFVFIDRVPEADQADRPTTMPEGDAQTSPTSEDPTRRADEGQGGTIARAARAALAGALGRHPNVVRPLLL
jgi:anti-sigma B factor antagonist